MGTHKLKREALEVVSAVAAEFGLHAVACSPDGRGHLRFLVKTKTRRTLCSVACGSTPGRADDELNRLRQATRRAIARSRS